jgi:hypothetical protein
MNDKIKVWKCATCIEKEPCIVGSIDSESELTTETKQCILKGASANKPKWQPTTEYKIVKKQPTKPQPTRYRLEIPEDILQILGNTAEMLNGHEIIVTQYDGDYCFVNRKEQITTDLKVFVSWLIPIVEDEQVVTAEEWMIENHNSCTSIHHTFDWKAKDYDYNDMLHCFKESEKNNALRHRETESFEDIVKIKFGTRGVNRSDYDVHDLQKIWQACLKSRGFDG